MNARSPLVSVILPAYNAEKTIAQAVDSVLNQTYKNIELIVCIDASPDNTLAILKQYSDLRLKIIVNEKNMGAGASRDKAISLATGDWFAFIDADDFWDEARLEIMLAENMEKTAYVIFDNLKHFRSKENTLVEAGYLRHRSAFNNYGKNKVISTTELLLQHTTLIQPLFSRQLLEQSKAKHSRHAFGEDFYFLLRLLSKSKGLIYIPEALYWYRVGEISASSSPQKYHQLLEVIQQSMSLFQSDTKMYSALETKMKKIQKDIKRFNFGLLIKSGKIVQALFYLLKKPIVIYYIIEHNLHKLFKR